MSVTVCVPQAREVRKAAVISSGNECMPQALAVRAEFADLGAWLKHDGIRPCWLILSSGSEKLELVCLTRGHGQLCVGGQRVDLGSCPLLLGDA
jgi:hypothetical protein